MAKHLIDLDEAALRSARSELGTATIKDTVNEALQRASGKRRALVVEAMDVLAGTDFADRTDAWR